MHTKLKGDIGELIVAQNFLKNGWNIAFPYGENMKYDLIAEKDGICKRIQVKSVSPRDGALKINCRSSNNWSVVHYEPKDFEFLAAVNINTQEVFLIPSDKMRKSQINLRLESSKNSQTKGIHFSREFQIDDVLKKMNLERPTKEDVDVVVNWEENLLAKES